MAVMPDLLIERDHSIVTPLLSPRGKRELMILSSFSGRVKEYSSVDHRFS